jgi:hypothetical protein
MLHSRTGPQDALHISLTVSTQVSYYLEGSPVVIRVPSSGPLTFAYSSNYKEWFELLPDSIVDQSFLIFSLMVRKHAQR